MAKKKKGKPFVPFVTPTRPPVGSYDPALDASVRASGRGYGDLQQDTGLADQRSLDDYQIAQNNLQEQRTNTLADILRNINREDENYQTDASNRVRQYGILANNQNQSANAAGVIGGGFTPQAAGKRQVNQGLEQTAADTAHFRARDDYATAQERTNTATDEQLAQIGLDYGRGVTDRGTTLERAGRENILYGQDVNESAWAQARASGMPLPTKPANEGFRVGTGGTKYYYQRQAGGGAVLPSGRRLSNTALRNYLRQRGVK